MPTKKRADEPKTSEASQEQGPVKVSFFIPFAMDEAINALVYERKKKDRGYAKADYFRDLVADDLSTTKRHR